MTSPSTAAPTTTAHSSTSSSATINLPGSISAGDLLVMFIVGCSISNNNSLWGTPTGWTFIGSSNTSPTSGTLIDCQCFAKEATGSEGSTETVTPDADMRSYVAHVFKVTGWSEDTLKFPAMSSAISGGSGTNPDPPSLNPSFQDTEDFLWFAFTGNGDDDVTVSGGPSGYSDLTSTVSGAGTNAGCSIGTAWKASTAESENPGTFTLDSTEAFIIMTISVDGVADAQNVTGSLISEGDSVLANTNLVKPLVDLLTESDSILSASLFNFTSVSPDILSETDEVLSAAIEQQQIVAPAIITESDSVLTAELYQLPFGWLNDASWYHEIFRKRRRNVG